MNTLLVLLQQPTQQGTGAGLPFWVMMVALILIFWLFFIRPQNKRAKEQQKFRNELSKGDKVMTIGGIHGKVHEVRDTTVVLLVDGDVKIEFEKSTIVRDGSQVGQA